MGDGDALLAGGLGGAEKGTLRTFFKDLASSYI